MITTEPGLPAAALREAADPARFARLFVEHYSWVWRTLRRLGVHPGAVDDAAQQVFLATSQRLQHVPPEKERAFLMAVTVRTASNARRTQSRRREEPASDEEPMDEPGRSPEELLEWKQRRAKLDEWLSALPLDLRVPFVLFELEGLTLVEISELCKLPLGTIKTRLRRARGIFLEATQDGGPQ
ncbi:MAG: sigma-70 family RNA polymerase sigma factor [Polyangiaceae bacterium]